MLARVANNLFWMGRYIERSEHLARYLNVNYFSSLDAPDELSQSRQFVLRSIMYMADNEIIDADFELMEEDVLFDVGLNPEKPNSIINIFKYKVKNLLLTFGQRGFVHGRVAGGKSRFSQGSL